VMAALKLKLDNGLRKIVPFLDGSWKQTVCSSRTSSVTVL